jgi:hypothetical protein
LFRFETKQKIVCFEDTLTGRPQESRRIRITSENTALFPPTRGGEREKGKRDTSLQSMVNGEKSSKTFLMIHPLFNNSPED